MIRILGKLALKFCLFAFVFIILFTFLIGRVGTSLNDFNKKGNIKFKFNHTDMFNELDNEIKSLIGN